MNWGNSIFLAFVLFAAFILYMVVKAFDQNIDLVATDYYAQELNYQQKLDQKKNLETLDKRVAVKMESNSMILHFPTSQSEGEIHLYHTSRSSFDQKIAISTDIMNQQAIDKESLVSGNYRLNITWKSENTAYFQQEKIFIQ